MKTILEKVQAEFGKKLAKEEYYRPEQFIADCDRYIKAVKEGRVICSIGSVAPSGMSRTLKFVEMTKAKGDKQHRILNFYGMFRIMGFQQIDRSDYFRIHGCGMDMVFHTNYTIIHKLQRLGFITKKTCDKLAQVTPHVI